MDKIRLTDEKAKVVWHNHSPKEIQLVNEIIDRVFKEHWEEWEDRVINGDPEYRLPEGCEPPGLVVKSKRLRVLFRPKAWPALYRSPNWLVVQLWPLCFVWVKK